MNLAGIEISYLLRDLAAKNSGYYLSNVYALNSVSSSRKRRMAFLMHSLSTFGSSSKIAPIEENRKCKILLAATLTNVLVDTYCSIC